MRKSLLAASVSIAALALSSSQPLIAQSDAVFKAQCRYSHSAGNDPIVFPGKTGAAHRHDFFGNRTTNAFTTTSSLVAGATTCSESRDHASYWVPSIARRNADGSLSYVVPTLIDAYYNFGGTNPPLTSYPLGLRVIAGDAMNIEALDTRFAFWQCLTLQGNVNRSIQAQMPKCASGEYLTAVIHFPDCWDGKHLDSADHKSHIDRKSVV